MIDKIEKYVTGKLSPQATKKFEIELANNQLLKEGLANYKIADAAIELLVADKTEAYLK